MNESCNHFDLDEDESFNLLDLITIPSQKNVKIVKMSFKNIY